MEYMIKPNNTINTSISKLQALIDILEDLNGKRKYTNYNTLCKDLLENFGLRIELKEIREFYEPTLEETKTDLQLILNNI